MKKRAKMIPNALGRTLKFVRFVELFVGFVLLFSFLPVYATPPSQDDTEMLASAVVHLLVTTPDGAQQGSGVIVSPEGIIFTAGHVVENASEIRIDLFDGFDKPPRTAYYARVQYVSAFDSFDFAVLEVIADDQGRTIDPATLGLPYAQAWSHVAVVRESVEIFGYLQSAAGVPHVTKGIIGSTPRQPIPTGGVTPNRYVFYQTDAIASDGDSGGMAVNAENEFIGIPITWENDEGGYVATILPLSTICEVYPDACTYDPATTGQILPPTDSSAFHPLDLRDSINEWTWYLGLTRGQVTLANGIPFEVGQELNTRGCRQEISETTIEVDANVASPQAVYFLVNAGNGFSSWGGAKIGELVLVFSTGQLPIDLILGENIRDWVRNPEPGVVTTVTNPATTEVAHGVGYDGREGRVDMITVAIPQSYRDSSLLSVQVVDITGGYPGSGTDPCIQVQAITVESEQ